MKIEDIVGIAEKAGERILEIYGKEYEVSFKDDKSPLTEADVASNDVIIDALKQLTPEIPVLSEESKEVAYAERKNWGQFWLVDPLDGTKDFINKTGDFTVNIALISGSEPILGVVYAPAKGKLYFGSKGEGAFCKEAGSVRSIEPDKSEKSSAHVVASRFHLSDETKEYVDQLKDKYESVEMVETGSSLKLCLVAEGRADYYPRFGPTMEWDTAAAHAVVLAAGAYIAIYPSGEQMSYNKENLLNPWFLVAGNKPDSP